MSSWNTWGLLRPQGQMLEEVISKSNRLFLLNIILHLEKEPVIPLQHRFIVYIQLFQVIFNYSEIGKFNSVLLEIFVIMSYCT
jgi:hypothetical protein